ncbi:MAG: NifU family protein [Bacteroidia bacterium]|nr:NifU family protein [Bacteroidia bacterium]
MQNNDIPWEFYVEGTPNPETMKFVASKLIIENGGTANYLNITETKQAPLIQKLFEFPFTKAVFVSGNYLTITKHNFINWEDVFIEVKNFLTDYTRSGKPLINDLPKKDVPVDNEFKETKTVYTEHAIPKNEVEAKIIETLENYIRPAVEQDGGLITFKSFEDGVVTVQMRGACSGCPSSTMTLKAGIEALLKRLLPEQVKEVVSEAL